MTSTKSRLTESLRRFKNYLETLEKVVDVNKVLTKYNIIFRLSFSQGDDKDAR